MPIATIERISYDGESVSLRLTLTASDSPCWIDGRVVENVHLRIDRVRDCDGTRTPFFVEDFFPSAAEMTDLVLLRSGFFTVLN